MRIVERPDSTTYIDEFPFHYLKNAGELINAVEGVEAKDIILWKKSVNSTSFMPEVWFLVRVHNDPAIRFMGFVAPLMHASVEEHHQLAHLKDAENFYA